MRPVSVLKADGTRELFRETKLRQSLKKAGATNGEVELIMRDIEGELFDGITTEILYRRAFELLRGLPQPAAARYSLRRALFGLGPTGFPFEDYLAKLYQHDGYRTKTRAIIRGKCTTHELDVIAWKPDDCVVAEAKFHQQPGTKSDLQVVLYTYARFLDLEAKSLHSHKDVTVRRTAVITNTKFTTAAIEYAKCVGMELIGWDHPRERSLQKWIEHSKLYPVTALSNLRPREKTVLLSQGVIMCSDLIDKPAVLSSVGLTKTRVRAVLDEARLLCTP